MNVNSLKARRYELKTAAENLLNASITSKKDLTGAELERYNAHVAELKTINAQLDRHAELATFVTEPSSDGRPIVVPYGTETPVNKNGKVNIFGRTDDGREIPIFSKGQSVAAHLKETRHEQSNLSFGELMRAMAVGGGSREVRAALSIGTDSAGGFTVPTILSGQLIDALRARSVMFEAGARTVVLDAAKSTTIASIVGDPTATWRAENADVATSDMTFGSVSFVPKSLAVIVTASRELIEDSLNLDEALRLSFAAALGGELDRVALIGSGTGSEPKGVSNTSGVGSYSMGTNGAALSDWSPFVEALNVLQTANAQDPTAVIIAPRSNKEIGLLADSTGQPLRRPQSIENLPFLVTSKLPINETQGTSNAASRAVMGYFPDVLVGVRSELRVEVLREKYADKYQYGFLAHLRADIAVAHPANFCNVLGIN